MKAELAASGIDLRKMGIKPNSWEERLVVQCRSKLAVRPKKAEAVLFYDQMPMGGQDDASLHGGCPVLKGTKWAANLWVWNGNVHGEEPAGKPGGAKQQSKEEGFQAQFVSHVPGHSLYWQDTFFFALEAEAPVRMNTFEGHVFHIHEGTDAESKGARVATFVMQPDTGKLQRYSFPAPEEEAEEGFVSDEEEEEEWAEDDDEGEYVYEDE